MKMQNVCGTDRPGQSLRLSSAMAAYRGATFSREKARLRRLHTQCVPCIWRSWTDISSEELRVLLIKVLPDRHEQLLAVVDSNELLRSFQERAALAFCTEDPEYFLRNTPIHYPFCFAGSKGGRVACRKHHYPYTFDDLADIAEGLLSEKSGS